MVLKKFNHVKCTVLVLFLLVGNLMAELYFTECLVFKTPRQARFSMIPNDPVERALVEGVWNAPGDGEEVILNDTLTVTWQKQTADSTGWFSGRDFSGSYAYISADLPEARVMLLEAAGHQMVYVNGEARIGNRYQSQDEFESWQPRFDFSLIPVELKAGKNDLLFQCSRGRFKAKLIDPVSSVQFNMKDPTLPDLIIGEDMDTWGAVIVINATGVGLENITIESDHPIIQKTTVPVIQPFSLRKVGFRILGKITDESGSVTVPLNLMSGDDILDTQTITLRVKKSSEIHKRTFISTIDGSVQYYAVNPAGGNISEPKALLLSVHGANVEGLNQAGSYHPKSWMNIVSPTNRRPYGYNWEDWGRLDAMEVLSIARQKYLTDPERVYLSGHSMGGHGTWHLGAMYPDKFAAIGPSAGWISFWSYRRGRGEEEMSPMRRMIMRATSPSRTMDFVTNYRQHGIYIIHGDADDNVRVDQARMMVTELEKVHKDFVYHEEPGAGHWWDVSDENGTDCVDWAPMFDFFARHSIPHKEWKRDVEFRTASPGVSARNYWVCIAQQQRQFEFSDVNIRFDPGLRRFRGTTNNVLRIGFDLAMIEKGETFTVELDSQQIGAFRRGDFGEKIWFTRQQDGWKASVEWPLEEKGPHRYGSFKSAFQNHFLLVYGTHGNEEENNWSFQKARYDAETFWYQGNGSVDVLSDRDFKAEDYPDRSVIVYGNATTNAAWNMLLRDSPVQVTSDNVTIGEKAIKGENLAVLFVRPRADSKTACVGVVGGTGLTGMRTTTNRNYLYAGSAYPDVMVFDSGMLEGNEEAFRAAGFFGPDWNVESGEFEWQ